MYKKTPFTAGRWECVRLFFCVFDCGMFEFSGDYKKKGNKGRHREKNTYNNNNKIYRYSPYKAIILHRNTFSITLSLDFSVAFIRGSWLMQEIHKTNNKFNGNKYAFQFRI